jgi:hypothetical protein
MLIMARYRFCFAASFALCIAARAFRLPPSLGPLDFASPAFCVAVATGFRAWLRFCRVSLNSRVNSSTSSSSAGRSWLCMCRDAGSSGCAYMSTVRRLATETRSASRLTFGFGEDFLDQLIALEILARSPLAATATELGLWSTGRRRRLLDVNALVVDAGCSGLGPQDVEAGGVGAEVDLVQLSSARGLFPAQYQLIPTVDGAGLN